MFERIVPISITAEELDNRVFGYMASGNFTPDDLLEVSKITLRERIYVPAFLFKVNYEANWTASFGFDREESYTAYRTRSRSVQSSGDSTRLETYQEPYTARRTVTDWRSNNGVDSGVFNIGGYAGKKLSDISIAPADLVVTTLIKGSAINFKSSVLSDCEVEEFTAPASAVIESLKSEINNIIGQRVRNHGQGDRQRDWHWNFRMSHSATTYAVPICHVTFQYKDKEYNVWVSGHDVNDIRADKLPVDTQKKNAVIFGFIPAAIGLFSLFFTAIIGSFSGYSLIAGFGPLVYALIRRSEILKNSKSVREKILSNLQIRNKETSDLKDDLPVNSIKKLKLPEPSFFAKTHRDNLVLPALATLAIFGTVIPNMVLNRWQPDQSENLGQKINTQVQTAQEVSNLKSSVEDQKGINDAAAKAATDKNGVIEVPNSDTSLTAQNVNKTLEKPISISPSELKGQNVPLPTSQALLSFATNGNWQGFQEAILMLLDQPKPPTGNRKLARQLNDQAIALSISEIPKSLTLLRQAHDADPADAEIADNLGMMLRLSRNYDESEAQLLKVLGTWPNMQTAWGNLAQTLSLKNKRREAIGAYVAAYKVSNNPEKVEEVYQRIVHNALDMEDPQLRKDLSAALEIIRATPK